MTEPASQPAATPEPPAATPVQPAANPEPPAASPAQPAPPRDPSNGAAQLLNQINQSLAALPEQIANVLAERNPTPPAKATPPATKQTPPAEPAKQVAPASASTDPWHVKLQRAWFG